jgi:hypothetical protein
MRSNKDNVLEPRRGEKGDDFWRRFSIVVKDEQVAQGKKSWWLRKTMKGTYKASRTVYVVGLVLLFCIAGAIGLGWYASHNSTSNSPPKAVGGTGKNTESFKATSTHHSTSATIVTPTYTLNDRSEPTPAALAVLARDVEVEVRDVQVAVARGHAKRKAKHLR